MFHDRKFWYNINIVGKPIVKSCTLFKNIPKGKTEFYLHTCKVSLFNF